MKLRQRILTTLTLAAVCFSAVPVTYATGTLLRWHKMGEEEGGTNNAAVSTTLDSPINGGDFTALDLSASNSPVYRTVSGRPDGGTGVGIEFSAASQQSLNGFSLNWPQQSGLDANAGGQYNLQGIEDRDFQLWVKPTSTAAGAILMDSNNHGVRVNSNGKFAMRYIGVDFESSVTVTPNTWYHIEVVHPGGTALGSRMYINGNAAAIAIPSVTYPGDTMTPLAVGSNVNLNGDFFSGVVDDLRMKVFGVATSAPFDNYGSFNFATDNAFAASPISGLKGIPGDVNNDGSFTATDKTAFISGWMYKRVVNGFQIGDMISHAQGDLNLDGITDIQDLLVMQNVLTGAGMASITASELSGVPEPSTIMALLALLWTAALKPRRGVR